MAKMTTAQLKSFVSSYVNSAKQGGSWTPSADSISGLIEKVSKLVTIDGDYQDKLGELDAENLPEGYAIEEWFMDLVLPTAYSNATTEGAKDVVPEMPTFEDTCYSVRLGRNKIKITEPSNTFDRYCRDGNDAGSITAKILGRLENSYSLYRYNVKKQALGIYAKKAVTKGGECLVSIAKPEDDTTGEAFIQAVKDKIEAFSFAHEGGLKGALIGAAPSLILYVKPAIKSVLDVQVEAGAFNPEKLGLGIEVKVLDDFGSGSDVDDDVYAILIDPRGLKYHANYDAVRVAENADGDFRNIVRHTEGTIFQSCYTAICAFKDVA